MRIWNPIPFAFYNCGMSENALHTQSESPEETEAVGFAMASIVQPGSVIALYGDLAAGKTCFVRGLARGLNVQEPVSSPTFTIVNEYHGTQTVFHLDLYRLTTVGEIYDLGYEELFDGPPGICVIEWAERAEGLLPSERVDVRFEHMGEDVRRISIESHGASLTDGWLAELRAQFPQES